MTKKYFGHNDMAVFSVSGGANAVSAQFFYNIKATTMPNLSVAL